MIWDRVTNSLNAFGTLWELCSFLHSGVSFRARGYERFKEEPGRRLFVAAD